MRLDRAYRRCSECASIFRDLHESEFQTLHDEAFTDDVFIQRQLLQQAPEPSHSVWRSIPRRATTGRMLEIGPGTGHLMAAAAQAGWDVVGVEHSQIHRDFIRNAWSLPMVFASLTEVPGDLRFDLIVLVNVLEHVYDVRGLLSTLRGMLAPRGEVFISAPNAECLVAKVMGTRWSMFKPSDHVSLPSREGLHQLGECVGLKASRVWSTELPFETPLGFLVALRDSPGRDVISQRAGEAQDPALPGAGLKHKIMQAINRMDGRWEPSNRLMGWWGRAGSIKVIYRLPESGEGG